MYNGPDAKPPPNWERVKTFIYACALYAAKEEVEKTKASAMGGGAAGLMG